MKFAVIIPWADTGCMHRYRAFEFVRKRCQKLNPDEVIIAEGNSKAWNKGKVVNQAVMNTDADVLLILDADVCLNWKAVKRHIRLVKRGTIISPCRAIRRLNIEQTNNILTGGRVRGSTATDMVFHLVGGAFMITRADFIEVGGFDERYEGWGWEDTDLAHRLIHKQCITVECDAIHLYHPPCEEKSLANRRLYDDRLQSSRRHAILSTKSIFAPYTKYVTDTINPVRDKFDYEKMDLDMQVFGVLYGRSPQRLRAVRNTFEKWDKMQKKMPQVVVAWCYDEDPEELKGIDYPWLKKVRLPQYDLDDNIFRKEGLLNLLIRNYGSAKYFLTLDLDTWTTEPYWFCMVQRVIAMSPDTACQPFAYMEDTKEPIDVYSWSSSTLAHYYAPSAIQPGLGWGFHKSWADQHHSGVFNPWLVTGSGDCMFILEHFDGDSTKEFERKHRGFNYFNAVLRNELPKATLRCVDVHVMHENHSNPDAVPEQYRNKPFADRAYFGSRMWLNMIGPLADHIHLDENGVPMPNDPDGPFVRMTRRKPELQDRNSLQRAMYQEFGHFVWPASKGDYAYIAKQDEYYGRFDRWTHYYAPIVRVVGMMSLRDTKKGILEVGPYKFPLIQLAQRMDIKHHGCNNTTIHDANIAPWPYKDKQFSLVIASHCFEHFSNPSVAFKELQRICDRAIIAIPHKWENGDDGHIGLTKETLEEWSQGIGDCIYSKITGPADRQQLMVIWEFGK